MRGAEGEYRQMQCGPQLPDGEMMQAERFRAGVFSRDGEGNPLIWCAATHSRRHLVRPLHTARPPVHHRTASPHWRGQKPVVAVRTHDAMYTASPLTTLASSARIAGAPCPYTFRPYGTLRERKSKYDTIARICSLSLGNARPARLRSKRSFTRSSVGLITALRVRYRGKRARREREQQPRRSRALGTLGTPSPQRVPASEPRFDPISGRHQCNTHPFYPRDRRAHRAGGQRPCSLPA